MLKISYKICSNREKNKMHDTSCRPIDAQMLASFFDKDMRLIKEHEFRKSIFMGGVKKELREVVWKFLFQFYQFNSTNNERLIRQTEKYVEYYIMKYRWNLILNIIKEKKKRERLNSVPDDYCVVSTDDENVTIPPIPFCIEIDMNKDAIRQANHFSSDSHFSLESVFNQENTLNIASIKLQTILKVSRAKISNKELLDDVKLIDKDVERTGYLMELEKACTTSHEVEKIGESLRNILITFAAFNQTIDEKAHFDLGYTQGMNELASIFLSVFNQESVAYWCFSNFMLMDKYSSSSITLNTRQISDTHILKTNVAFYFSSVGISKKLQHLNNLLAEVDPELHALIASLGLSNLFFCHEWLLLCFKRCFSSRENYQHCFELLNSHYIEFHTSVQKNVSPEHLYSFDLFICLALLSNIRDQVLNECKCEADFYEVFRLFNKSNYFENNFEQVLQQAEHIFNKYCVRVKLEDEILIDSNREKRNKSWLDKIKNILD